MILDRRNGAKVRIPELVFERYRCGDVRLLPGGSPEEVILSALIVRESHVDREVVGYLNLVMELEGLRCALDSFAAGGQAELLSLDE